MLAFVLGLVTGIAFYGLAVLLLPIFLWSAAAPKLIAFTDHSLVSGLIVGLLLLCLAPRVTKWVLKKVNRLNLVLVLDRSQESIVSNRLGSGECTVNIFNQGEFVDDFYWHFYVPAHLNPTLSHNPSADRKNWDEVPRVEFPAGWIKFRGRIQNIPCYPGSATCLQMKINAEWRKVKDGDKIMYYFSSKYGFDPPGTNIKNTALGDISELKSCLPPKYESTQSKSEPTTDAGEGR